MVSVAGFFVDSADAGGSDILECIERFLVFVFLGLISVVGLFKVSVTLFYGFRYMVLWFPLRFMVSVAGFLVDSAAAGGS